MSAAQLHADVQVTIAPWRCNGMQPPTAWWLLTGVTDCAATWFRVEQYMSAWLASREQSAIQPVG